MSLEDTIPALYLSSDESWNQTEKDWRFLIGNPLNIGVLAAYEDKIIGTTIAVTYTDQLAWISMVLVNKAFRGRGISKKLLQEVFNQLTSYKSIKLDATLNGLQVYKKLDFKEEYSVLRMVRTSYQHSFSLSETNNKIFDFRGTDINEIIDLDAKIFGSPRSRLIKYLAKEYPGTIWCSKPENKVSGCVLGREGSRFHHIGPVLAKNTTEAQYLILKALMGLDYKPVIIDVPEDKPGLLAWLRSIGFIEQRRFVRMYKNANTLSGNQEQLFAICGPEYG